MTRVLHNIEAPYQNWITVFRNIVKYSPLRVIEYVCCRSHMLFSECVISGKSPLQSLRPTCEICIRESTQPSYVTFKYISIQSLRPTCEIRLRESTQPSYVTFKYISIRERVISWIKSDRTFELLFHGPKRDSEGNITPRSNNEVRDYYEGLHYREYVEANGGQHQFKYDVFLVVSTDGFEVYNSRRYDCWPLIAHVLNLDPVFRTSAANVVPLGFVGGGTQPKDLESFLKPMVAEIQSINSEGGISVKRANLETIRVGVHILRMTSDLKALPKFSGHLGPSA